MFDLLSSVSWAAVCVILLSLSWIRFRPGIRQVPGPFWASILPFHRLWKMWNGNAHEVDVELHRKYGDLVRVGPNHVLVAGAKNVAAIYPINGKFRKSDYYTLMDFPTAAGPMATVGSVRDETHHRALKRPVAAAYNMSTMIELEDQVDICVQILLEQRFPALVGQAIDLGNWMQCFAFDVITAVSFSERIGFLDAGEDILGIMAAIEARFRYISFVGQLPALNRIFGTPLGAQILRMLHPSSNATAAKHVVAFAGQRIDRYKTSEADKQYRDLLDRFKKSKDGDPMTDRELLAIASTSIAAGADTTGTVLKAVFWLLHKNPNVRYHLLEELDTFEDQISTPITFAESMKMPYWQACLKEVLRFHPPPCIMLERFVPAGGVMLSETFLPEGTIVGTNPWAVAYDSNVFGEDAGKFRPERWLISDVDKLQQMERHSLVWGAGSRTCLGKNIALMEINKLVPEILRNYEVELVYTERYSVFSHVASKQDGLFCQLRKRK